MRIEVLVPGGLVAGDVVIVPPGLAAPTSDALESLRAFARAGGKLLGLADGVTWLCAAGLLPGGVATSEADAPATHVRVEGRATPFTWAIPAGRIVPLASPTGAHRYHAPDADVAALATRGRIVMRYCDGAGGVAGPHADTVAGLCDETGHVVGLVAPTTAELACALGRQLRACLQPR
jgi:phosphoribosylformylglycinamidine (FGAM) synthase-like amidotransferase family enzyme